MHSALLSMHALAVSTGQHKVVSGHASRTIYQGFSQGTTEGEGGGGGLSTSTSITPFYIHKIHIRLGIGVCW